MSSPADYPPLVHLSGGPASVDGLSSCSVPGVAQFVQSHAQTLLSPPTALPPPPVQQTAVVRASAPVPGTTCSGAFEPCSYEQKPQSLCGLHPLTYCTAATSVYPTPPHNSFYGAAAGVQQEAASPGPGPIMPLSANTNTSALYAQQYSHAWAQAQGMYAASPFIGVGAAGMYQPQANANSFNFSGGASVPHECRAFYGFQPPMCSPPFEQYASAFGAARLPSQATTTATAAAAIGGGGWLDNSQVAPSL